MCPSPFNILSVISIYIYLLNEWSEINKKKKKKKNRNTVLSQSACVFALGYFLKLYSTLRLNRYNFRYIGKWSMMKARILNYFFKTLHFGLAFQESVLKMK